MLHRYIQREFIDTTTMTVGVDFATKKVQISDITVVLQLWDIGGQERFRFMVENYLRGAHGALLLFDTTSMTSFVNIQKWYQLLRRDNPNLPIVLVGTKKDLEEFSMVGDYYAEKTKEKFFMIDYIKTSSKLGLNVDKAFDVIVEYLLKNSLIGWEDVEYEKIKRIDNLKERALELNDKIELLMKELFQGGEAVHDIRQQYSDLRQELDNVNAELTKLEIKE